MVVVPLDERGRVQAPDLVATPEPAILVSPFVHGIKRLPVAFIPPR
jgi:methyl-branched lipid omega-hydroxylase